MSELIDVQEDNFDAEVLQSPKPVLAEFWKEACGRCKMLAPLIDEFAEEQAAALKVVKVKVDENANLARRFDIRVTPTLLYVKDGAMRGLITDFVSKKSVLSQIAALDQQHDNPPKQESDDVNAATVPEETGDPEFGVC
jgi:thioredoxin 1